MLAWMELCTTLPDDDVARNYSFVCWQQLAQGQSDKPQFEERTRKLLDAKPLPRRATMIPNGTSSTLSRSSNRPKAWSKSISDYVQLSTLTKVYSAHRNKRKGYEIEWIGPARWPRRPFCTDSERPKCAVDTNCKTKGVVARRKLKQI